MPRAFNVSLGGGDDLVSAERSTPKCRYCDGECDAFVVHVTGRWAHLDYAVLSGVRYFVHGAVCKGEATTLWLVPA